MDYFVNPSCFASAFVVPTELCDKYLKLAKGEHIKVLLYMLRNNNGALSEEIIAENLSISAYDVKEALLFWADAGILIAKEAPKPVTTEKKAYQKIVKPTRDDVIMLSQQDPKIKWLSSQSQLIFGRNLTQSEWQTLVWIYHSLGLDIDVLFVILNHAKNIDRLKISFIQSLAIEWLDKGIDTVSAADEELKVIASNDLAWTTVRKAFGLPPRKPTKKEKDYINAWVNEWQMSEKMLEAAYEACVDAKGEVKFPYINGILKTWHDSGYKTPDDIVKISKKDDSHGSAYDLDLFEEMLNQKD